MLVIPGRPDRSTCDGVTRRELLRVGGSSMFGLGLANLLRLRAAAAAAHEVPHAAAGWDRARSVILLYLQGGPSHLDLWDPKPSLPESMRSAFNTIDTRL